MTRYFFILGAAILTLFTQCETLQGLPTNTSGGLFSLNGTWQLSSISDNRALEGTVVAVVPGIADGTVRTLANNTYCLRERDVLWRALKNNGSGNFSLETLASACSGTAQYKPATLTVLSNDEIRVTGQNAANAEVIQTWRRVVNQ